MTRRARLPFEYIPAEPPCMKGEIRGSIFGIAFVLGWQLPDRALTHSHDTSKQQDKQD